MHRAAPMHSRHVGVQHRSFQDFVSDNNLEEKAIPLSKLSRLPDTNQVVLAYDGNKILDAITEAVREEDKMSIFTSSTPLAVYTHISEYCEEAEALGKFFQTHNSMFKPVFLFNGCGFMPDADLDLSLPSQPNEVAHCRAFHPQSSVKNIPIEIQRKFAPRFSIDDDVEGLIVRRFHEKITDTFCAPYHTWSQISAFFAPSNRYISEVYGCLELLAFPGIERVVTSIDVKSGTFGSVRKSDVLAAIRKKVGDITDDELSAFILLDSKNKQFRVPGHLIGFEELCSTGRWENLPRHTSYLQNGRATEDQRKLLRRNLAALDSPVLLKDGKCIFLSSVYNRPKNSDVGLAFGRPIPSIFYYFFMGGPVMPAPIASVAHSALSDGWPLVDTSGFRRVAEIILPLRVQIIYQLMQFAHIDCSMRWLRQYVVFRGAPHDDHRWSSVSEPPDISLSAWDVYQPENMSPNEADNIYFLGVLRFSECAVMGDVLYSDVNTTVSAVLLRSLDLLGYFTHSTDAMDCSGSSVYTRALEKFTCPTLSEYGVLLIELVRTGTLTDSPLEVSMSQAPERYPPGVRFASRLLSIIPLNVNGPWTGPFDPEMAAYGMASRLLSKTLRYLTETIACLLFATKSTKVPLDCFGDVVAKLPFSIPTEFNAGYLITFLLMNPHTSLSELRSIFPELYYLEDDLRTLFWFWTMAFEAITVIAHEEPEMINIQWVLDAHMCVSEACSHVFPDFWSATFAPLQHLASDAMMLHESMCGVAPQQMPMQMPVIPLSQMGTGMGPMRF